MKLLITSFAALISLTLPGNAAKCDLRDGVTTQQGRSGLCDFDKAARSFKGDPLQQAKCLTRSVAEGAHIGEPTLGIFLSGNINSPLVVDTSALKTYLQGKNVGAEEIGGSIGEPISAAYFIIHDTSTPNCSQAGVSVASCPVKGEFPAARDTADWPDNKGFQGHPKSFPNRLANIFTNRVGKSVTEADFAETFVSTKFEQCSNAKGFTGLFVSVENIQPRIGRPAIPASGKKANDLIAPDPGFSASQYERLALLYVVASVRHGKWLVPAFHAVLDNYYADGHDDPQNFDMAAFDRAVAGLVDQLKP